MYIWTRNCIKAFIFIYRNIERSRNVHKNHEYETFTKLISVSQQS